MTGHRDRHRTTPDISGLSGQGNLDKKPDIGGVSPAGRAPACSVCPEPRVLFVVRLR
jgi:hypothetical protein